MSLRVFDHVSKVSAKPSGTVNKNSSKAEKRAAKAVKNARRREELQALVMGGLGLGAASNSVSNLTKVLLVQGPAAKLAGQLLLLPADQVANCKRFLCGVADQSGIPEITDQQRGLLVFINQNPNLDTMTRCNAKALSGDAQVVQACGVQPGNLIPELLTYPLHDAVRQGVAREKIGRAAQKSLTHVLLLGS